MITDLAAGCDPGAQLGEPPVLRQYSERDTILYALSVGVGLLDPVDPEEVKYVYEQRLTALPAYAATLAAGGADLLGARNDQRPCGVLHAGQWLRMHTQLPVAGEVAVRTRSAVRRARAGDRSVARIRHELSSAKSDTIIASSEAELLVWDEGSRIAARDGLPVRPLQSRGEPDMRVFLPVARNQALLYRMSGDYNPLHVDREAARQAGLRSPVLHGLASYGMVARALIKLLCADRPEYMSELRLRFSGLILPGEPLCLHVWRTEQGRATFQLIATERNLVVHDLGVFKYLGHPLPSIIRRQ